MARSRYIYTVVDGAAGTEPGDQEITAAFTVRRELVIYLQRSLPRDLPWLSVTRCLDGLHPDSRPVTLRAAEVLEGKPWRS